MVEIDSYARQNIESFFLEVFVFYQEMLELNQSIEKKEPLLNNNDLDMEAQLEHDASSM